MFYYAFLLASLVAESVSEFDCSDVQFWNREKRIENKNCTEHQKYHCAWDLFQHQYRDICWPITILIREGERPTIQGGLHKGECPKDRYQPFATTSDDVTDCVYLKSNCAEEGQVLHDETEKPNQDRTCRCDYRQGYTFVQKPKNICFCIPSQEDCSCYQKRCNNDTLQLSQDYTCVDQNSVQTNNKTYKCLPITGTKTSNQIPDELSTKADIATVSDSMSSSSTLATGLFVLALIFAVLVIVLMTSCPFCLKKIKSNKDLKEGQNASINFRVCGLSVIRNVKWTRDNSTTDLGSDVTGRYSKSLESFNHFSHIVTLDISDITADDAKNYVCHVYNVSNDIGCLEPSKRTFDLQILPHPAAAVKKRTKAEIEQHKKDTTYYKTDAVNKGINILKIYNTLFVKGHKGFGKTKVCLEIAKYFFEKEFCIFKFSTNDEKNPDKYISSEKDELCIYDLNIPNEELNQSTKDLLNSFHSHRDNKNVKFIITVLSNYESDRIPMEDFEEAQVLSLLQLSSEDKMGVLQKHMNKNNIKTCKHSYGANYNDGNPLFIWKQTVEKICLTDTLLGFPKSCKLFCENPSFLRLEERYFKNPPKWLKKEISSVRDNQDTKLQYAVLVYVMMTKKLEIHNVDKDRMQEILAKLNLKMYERCQLDDALENLSGKFLKQDEDTFTFYHETMSKSVWLTYMTIDSPYCLSNCNWEYIEDLVRPTEWPYEDETNDVSIRVNTDALLVRLSEEVKMRPYFVGVYLRRLSEFGKDVTDKLFNMCLKEQFETDNLTAVPLTLFEGLTDFGQTCDVFVRLNISNDILSALYLDRFRNNFFHYSVLYDYVNLVRTLTDNQIELFAGVANFAGYTALHITVYLGRKTIFENLFQKVPISEQLFRKLRKLSFKGSNQCKEMVDINKMETGPMVFRRGVCFGSREEFNFIKNELFKLKDRFGN